MLQFCCQGLNKNKHIKDVKKKKIRPASALILYIIGTSSVHPMYKTLKPSFRCIGVNISGCVQGLYTPCTRCVQGWDIPLYTLVHTLYTLERKQKHSHWKIVSPICKPRPAKLEKHTSKVRICMSRNVASARDCKTSSKKSNHNIRNDISGMHCYDSI